MDGALLAFIIAQNFYLIKKITEIEGRVKELELRLPA